MTYPKPKKGWFASRFEQGQEFVAKRLALISEVPGLPEPILEVLRHTRTSLLELVKGVRRKEDVKSLGASAVNLLAGSVDAIAEGSVRDPGDIRSVEDVRYFCSRAIKWGASIVDGFAAIVGLFAVAGAAPTGGLTIPHFLAMCWVLGLLYSLAIGACEVFAVTSLLVHEGAASPAKAAIALCAYPRRHRRSRDAVAELAGDAPTPRGEAGASREARMLASTWVKLSLAASMPVSNDRHMQTRLDALTKTLDARA